MIQGLKREAGPRRAPVLSKREGAAWAWGGGEAVLPRPQTARIAHAGVRARKQKLLILLSIQLAFFLGLWLAARRIVLQISPDDDPLSWGLVVPLALFFLSYFLINWRSVYSRDYHYYLRRVHGTVLKNALFPLALACLGFLLMGTWRAEPVLHAARPVRRIHVVTE